MRRVPIRTTLAALALGTIGGFATLVPVGASTLPVEGGIAEQHVRDFTCGVECEEEPPAAEEPPVEQPPTDDPPADEPPAEQPPTDEPPVEQPPVEDPTLEDPSAGEPDPAPPEPDPLDGSTGPLDSSAADPTSP